MISQGFVWLASLDRSLSDIIDDSVIFDRRPALKTGICKLPTTKS